jgi:hypothetical protein
MFFGQEAKALPFLSASKEFLFPSSLQNNPLLLQSRLQDPLGGKDTRRSRAIKDLHCLPYASKQGKQQQALSRPFTSTIFMLFNAPKTS